MTGSPPNIGQTDKEYIVDSINYLIDNIETTRFTGPNYDGHSTRYGLTQKFLDNYKYPYISKDMTYDEAVAVYYSHYYTKKKGKILAGISRPVSYEWFEQAVNLGSTRATKHLQSALNAINQTGEDLVVDGKLGPKTAKALEKHKALENVILKMIDSQQSVYYQDLAIRRPSYRRYVEGWHNKRVDNF